MRAVTVIVFMVTAGVSDAAADRMRIIAPVKRIEDATPEELLAALHANFHTLLDARYAVSNGVLFAKYLHRPARASAPITLAAVPRSVACAKARITRLPKGSR